MKTYITFLFAATLFLVAGSLQAQSLVEKVDIPFTVDIPCANDGQGESASGFITVHFVNRPDGSFHANPQGGVLVGAVTGISYHATGHTTFNLSTNGGTFVNRFHFVGKGTQFMVKETSRYTVNANGEVVVDFFSSEVICK